MFSLIPTTPLTITEDVRSFCQDVSPGVEPLYIAVTPKKGAKENDCFTVVEDHVNEYGGSSVLGWQIWVCVNVMIEAEAHSVWRDREGGLHDLTPKSSNPEKILFLSDSHLAYEGRQINSKRRSFSPLEEVKRYLEILDEKFEFMNSGERAMKNDGLQLDDAQSRCFIQIGRKKQNQTKNMFSALKKFDESLEKAARNDPCPCKSGLKFKKCHGRV